MDDLYRHRCQGTDHAYDARQSVVFYDRAYACWVLASWNLQAWVKWTKRQRRYPHPLLSRQADTYPLVLDIVFCPTCGAWLQPPGAPPPARAYYGPRALMPEAVDEDDASRHVCRRDTGAFEQGLACVFYDVEAARWSMVYPNDEDYKAWDGGDALQPLWSRRVHTYRCVMTAGWCPWCGLRLEALPAGRALDNEYHLTYLALSGREDD